MTKSLLEPIQCQVRTRRGSFPLMKGLTACIFMGALVASPATAALEEVPPGCDVEIATVVAASDYYGTCQSESQFTFDVSLNKTTSENAFCRSTQCLQVFRKLRTTAQLPCASVAGLSAVPLTKTTGQYNCFGKLAVTTNSDVIIRPGDPSTSGSGSTGSSSSNPTTPPPTPTKTTKTPEPSTTNEPTTGTPDPTSPVPTTTEPSDNNSTSGSGSKSPQPNNSTKTPTATTEAQSDGGGMDTGTILSIAGICIGVFVVVASLFYLTSRGDNRPRRSKQRPTYADYDDAGGDFPAKPPAAHRSAQYPGGSGGGTTTQGWHSGTAGFGSAFDGWDEELIAAVRVPYEKLSFDQLISRGGYGEVYRGTYRGQVVAIKTLLPERRRDMRQIQSFLAEVKLMATLEHERVVRLIGVAWDSLEELSVVTEYLERGDLRSVLAEFEATHSRPHGFDVDKVKIALHVAHALTYLHSMQPAILHRDLKSRNILLDAQLNAKVADFGISRERADQTMTAGVGSSLWMAPEVMMGERYDEKADVFSFGVVLSELDTHVLPYTHALEPGTGRKLPDAVILQMVSLGRIHVAFSDEERSDMAQIGLQCVSLNPDERPTAAEVLHLIHQVWRRWSH